MDSDSPSSEGPVTEPVFIFDEAGNVRTGDAALPLDQGAYFRYLTDIEHQAIIDCESGRAERRAKFIEALAKTGLPRVASKVAGVGLDTLKTYRDQMPEFAAAWDAALELATDTLELEARRRALNGVEKAVYYKGEEIGKVTEYSDSLLNTLLRANRPEKYRDRTSLEHTGPGGQPMAPGNVNIIIEGVVAEPDGPADKDS